MDEYIERSAAVCVANYAIDEHPYDKDPARPETFSDYNSGWNDACDYIQEQLESVPAADVAPVKHGRWEMRPTGMMTEYGPELKAFCTACNNSNKQYQPPYCPHCGAKMDGDGMDGDE